MADKTPATRVAEGGVPGEGHALYRRASRDGPPEAPDGGAGEDRRADVAQFESGLEALLNQRAAIQKNLEGATQRASQARLGESLERAQFSERLEVLEQAVLPQKPTKPNRPKMLGDGVGPGCPCRPGRRRGDGDRSRTPFGPRAIFMGSPMPTWSSQSRTSRPRRR